MIIFPLQWQDAARMPHFGIPILGGSPRYEAVPILALSGTAPPKRQNFIRHSLKLQNPLRCWIEKSGKIPWDRTHGCLEDVWNTLFEFIWYILYTCIYIYIYILYIHTYIYNMYIISNFQSYLGCLRNDGFNRFQLGTYGGFLSHGGPKNTKSLDQFSIKKLMVIWGSPT